MIGTIPLYSPYILAKIVEIFSLGLTGEMLWGFFIQFILNWLINFGSEFQYYVSNCDGERTANTTTLLMIAFFPAVIALILSVLINFVPILKTPLLMFTIFGGLWLVDSVVLLIGNYGPWSLALTSGARVGLLKNSCKKEKKEKK